MILADTIYLFLFSKWSLFFPLHLFHSGKVIVVVAASIQLALLLFLEGVYGERRQTQFFGGIKQATSHTIFVKITQKLIRVCVRI